ncbi:hypothetical protein [Streptomyces natalensis]|uniref:Uncharacterized protein n=1 Tax=Streptomyces natalensis ATCC 27448 TaxID=1240678 RepID=A0A0D7CKV4_9ACTN|nr:hypothetical protein [Streptomyces natalensis]KIZ16844.1 hypothetical protein SNA_17765 [Streptomyces natalensis ATCC 27448]
MVIPASSTEYLHITVTAPAGVDLTATTPRIAILSMSNRNNPSTVDWHIGDWASPTEARLLIGPDGGALTLTPGDYHVWVSVDPAGSENIVRLSGYLGIT